MGKDCLVVGHHSHVLIGVGDLGDGKRKGSSTQIDVLRDDVHARV